MIRSTILIVTLLLLAVSGCSDLHPAGAAASESPTSTDAVLLVENGQPRAVIIVPAVAAPAVATIDLNQANARTLAEKVAWAARDLQHYLEKISGAKLPIIADDQPIPPGPRILVGRSQLTGPYDATIPSGLTRFRTDEGYAILTADNTLVLAGNDEGPYHGTEYAVAFFLHRLGVRWYMPGDFGEVIPPQPTIAVANLHEVSRPDFRMRAWYTHWFADDLRPIGDRWKIHNGMGLDAVINSPGDWSGNLLPPPEEKDNPEYAKIFARDALGNVYPTFPNLSNEESVQYSAAKIKAYFKKNPQANSFGVGAPDGWPRDRSPATQKLSLNFPCMIGRFNDPLAVSTTEEWMQWVHRVSAEVHKDYPDKFLITNGYANRNASPFGMKPDRTIWIMFAAIFSDTYHALNNPRSWMAVRQYNMLKQWRSQYDHVYMYTYIYHNLVGCGAPPIPLARRHLKEMPLLKELGIVGFRDEGRTVRGESGIFPTYLRARMMWDADLDAHALMDEFFTTWYGPAAEPAFKFWDEMERAIEASNFGHNEDHILSLIYTPELIKRLAAHLKKAETLARGDVWAEPRVRADRATFDYLLAYKAMERAEAHADWVRAEKHARRMAEVIKPAMEISRFYWDIATIDKPTANQAYGFYYWGSENRRQYYEKMVELTTGPKGQMVKVLPQRAKFSVDPRDDGRFDGWYQPDWDDRDWPDLLTTKPFFAQGPYLDESGFPYLGAMWYRLDVDVPKSVVGKRVHLYCMNAETEAWVWVNGKFVGHRRYAEAYIAPSAIDMDVTDALIPGRSNHVAIRLHTNYQPAQMAAGLRSRLFLYSPKEQQEPDKD